MKECNVKRNLFGLTKSEIDKIVIELGQPRFRSNQIIDWLYKKDVKTIDEMKNLPSSLKEKLKIDFSLIRVNPVNIQVSNDGTEKFLWETEKKSKIESALIPDRERATLCLSTQSGCKRGCNFCMTASMGFLENISTSDILNQYATINKKIKITNIVFMGMGEPFDNYVNVMNTIDILTSDWGYGLSNRRITVSTVGIIGKLEKYISSCECHLAISMHNPFSDERLTIMPVEKIYPIKEVIEELKRLKPYFKKGRKLTFEYTLLNGINDSINHAKEISRLLNGLRASVNLIHYNSGSKKSFSNTPESNILLFQNELKKRGIPTNIRKSRGDDISAACGQLAGQS